MKIIFKKTIECFYECELDDNTSRGIIAYAKMEDCDLQTAISEVYDPNSIEKRRNLLDTDESIDIDRIELNEQEEVLCDILHLIKEE